jgi:hypothetical protein
MCYMLNLDNLRMVLVRSAIPTNYIVFGTVGTNTDLLNRIGVNETKHDGMDLYWGLETLPSLTFGTKVL